MLPPIDETILKSNPDFERLYKTVTSSLLNSDGSTKSHDTAAKKRDAVREELKAHRLRATKQHLLRRAIIAAANPEPITTSAAPSKQQQQQSHRRTRSMPQNPRTSITASAPASAPSPEILDLLLLLPPFLSNAATLPLSSLTLLLSRPPFSELPSLFPSLTTTLSTTLTRQASAVARVVNPHTNPSYIHRSIPTLAPTTTALQASLSTSAQTLSRSRQRATHDLTTHLSRHARAVAQLIRVLENKHGPAARSAELRAEDVGLTAREWALAAEALLWDARRTVYPAEAQRALANYRRHLGDARMRLADAMRVREAELVDYGVAAIGEEGGEGEESSKERTMREMARVWREMETRLGEVRGDLDRLA